MPGVVIKPRSRIFHGHEWVYSSEIKKVFGNPKAGDVVSLKDFKDRPLGSGIYNPQSQIVVRRISRRKQDLDLAFFKRRIERAIAHREKLSLDDRAIRLVWSESDGLPGVIVDRYGDCLVLQTLTLAMDQRQDLIVQALQELLDPSCVLARNDSPIRAAEGLPSHKGVLAGETPDAFSLELNGLHHSVDLLGGQKTGLYLDQSENHRLVASLAQGRRVLDVFSHQGGFALACQHAGATEVTGIEISEAAVEAARANAARNHLEATFLEANAFDQLRELEKTGERFDLVILDPPSFAKNKGALQGALRGYKEIHLRALRLLEPGGILATFSCSHHVNAEAFLEIIRSAAVDAKRTLRKLATYTQRADHPVIATIPETEYLRGHAFEVIPSW